MRLTFQTLATAFAGICCLCFSSVSNGQGLIHSLPEDGMAVEYEGTMVQSTNEQDQNPLTWTSELTIKSVGQERAEYQGREENCRWIEIKVVTGTSTAAGLDPGPVGQRIYKVLVPESKVISEPVDASTIPNNMLPIVKGYRREGEGETVEIRSGALVFYPLICRLRNYDEPEVIAESDTPEILASDLSITAKKLKGRMVMERQESRSTNEAEYWVSRDVPFGLAAWVVTDTREEKTATEPRDLFRTVTIVRSEMKLRAIRDSAESELATP